jgi:hypothetical protein
MIRLAARKGYGKALETGAADSLTDDEYGSIWRIPTRPRQSISILRSIFEPARRNNRLGDHAAEIFPAATSPPRQISNLPVLAIGEPLRR